MDVKKCDRCGSVFSQSFNVKDKISVEENAFITLKVKKYDLCRKCMGEFMTWFAEPEESVEHGKEIPDVYK